MSDLKDVINFAASGKATDFQAHIHDLLNQRAVDVLDAQREAISKSMFGADHDDTDIDIDEDSIDVTDEEIDDIIDDDDVTELLDEPEEE